MPQIKRKVAQFNSKYAMELRIAAGLGKVPQLLVYVVDRTTKAKEGSSTRMDLNSSEDLLGICINIPGDSRRTNYATTVSIHMPVDNTLFDDEVDIDGTDAD